MTSSARPVPDLSLLSKLDEPIPAADEKTIFDRTVHRIQGHRSTRNLVLGRASPLTATPAVNSSDVIEIPPDPPPTSIDPFKPTDETNLFTEKPAFLPPKPHSHSPKISPSSIPNPSPSVGTTKQVEAGFPNYSGYLYSIPGYSAFQPVAYQGLSAQPPQANCIPPVLTQKEQNKTDFVPFPSKAIIETIEDKSNADTVNKIKGQVNAPKPDSPKTQTDFEDNFTPEIIPATTDIKTPINEPKLNISSVVECSGVSNTVPTSIQDTKKKQSERFSLKTSIPISKIDMKCVNTPPDTTFHNTVGKKIPIPFNPAFLTTKETATKVEIQSNVVIKTAPIKEPEVKLPEPPNEINSTASTNSISTLINAAESLNKNDTQFWKKDQKTETFNNETKETVFPKPIQTNRQIFNPLNSEPKINFSNKPPDGFGEQKNQIVFIQNKNANNSKMFLTISQQQPNPQVLFQRTNLDSKNLQAPSRLSSLNKKCKEELVNENGTSSKVVALKRLHHENCDENDFENLITENQIYGNKIVVKEKVQGTQQEQDLKKNHLKITTEKSNQTSDTKNVVVQPNFLYLSNLQFPTNLMMIKNSNKVNQNSTEIKTNKNFSNENKLLYDQNVTANNDANSNLLKTAKTQNIAVSREMQVLKSSNNVLQTLSNKATNKDVVFQTNQKVIMNSQILYQVPMIVETDGAGNSMQKIAPTFLNREYTTFLAQNKKELPSTQEPGKPNDKLYIACPYQMETKMQPKIVITNIRSKISKAEEVSTLDQYEKRKRLRRLKHLTLRDKDQRTDIKKEKIELIKNVITPDKMRAEICKEFANSKVAFDTNSSDSDSDYEENELKEYESIMEKYGPQNVQENLKKIEFLSSLKLGTHAACKDIILDRQERSLSKDAVAAAYISAGRIDRITEDKTPQPELTDPVDDQEPYCRNQTWNGELESNIMLQRKHTFFKKLQLVQVSTQYKQDYERTWEVIVQERRRRNNLANIDLKKMKPKEQSDKMALDTKDQLQILTDIKNSVNENNNLIKKRLDGLCENLTANCKGDSIHTLAEKNFSELSRLSKMADRSVKLFSGQDTRKRDLNPGFDSENIQKMPKLHSQSYPNINIPNISKIISLKSTLETSSANTAPATSMDEPKNSAAASRDEKPALEEPSKSEEFGCQIGFPWPGIDAVLQSYKQFEIARKKEMADLHRRNTQLRVERANANRTSARETELARTLLAERNTLANDEHRVRMSIQKILAAIQAVKTYQ